MLWSHDAAYFFGGLFVTNAIPHWVSGLMGRPFQSPFATPRGEGPSSSTVNVLWGALNFVVGYLLLFHVGTFDFRNLGDVVPPTIAAVLGSLFLAKRFGRFNGGNDPQPGTPRKSES